jgi:hypothetical protein
MRYKINYREGDWFGVPLERGGWALGLVARADHGYVLGYFFGPRRRDEPELDEASGLKPANAVRICLLGDLGLVTNRWPVLGRLPGWRREEWPMPAFGHIDAVDPSAAYLRIYNENDLGELPREILVRPEEARQWPVDGLAGEGAAVIRLDHILPPFD